MRSTNCVLVGLGLIAACLSSSAQISISNAAIGTCFRYEGRLNNSNDFSSGPTPATGTFDFRFRIFDDPVETNAQHRLSETTQSLLVSNGLFATLLDFGDIFNGRPLYLEIGVRAAGVNTNLIDYTRLLPRHLLTAVPYAQWARKGGTEALHVVFNEPPDINVLLSGPSESQWTSRDDGPFVNHGPSLYAPGTIFATARRYGDVLQEYETNRYYFESRSTAKRVEEVRFMNHLSETSHTTEGIPALPSSFLFQLRFEVWRIEAVTLTGYFQGVYRVRRMTSPRFNRVIAGPIAISDQSLTGLWSTVPLLPEADMTIRPGEFLVAVVYARSDIALPSPFSEVDNVVQVCNVEVEAIVSSQP
jgi:hypothetical protein